MKSLFLLAILVFPVFGCAGNKYQKIGLATAEQISCRRLCRDKKGKLWICARPKGHKGKCLDIFKKHGWSVRKVKI